MEIEFRAGADPGKTMADAARVGLLRAAEFALEQANRTVPHEEGTLQRSGKAVSDGQALRAAVSYDTPYAVAQHENVTYRHNKGRRAKWLELTMREQQEKIAGIIAATIRGEL